MKGFTVNVRDAELAWILCAHVGRSVVTLVDEDWVVHVDISEILERNVPPRSWSLGPYSSC